MLIQQLTGNLRNMSGRLTVTAPAGELQALQDLAAELAGRGNVQTSGDITILPTEPVPPPIDPTPEPQ